MKPRRVIVQLELETDVPLPELRKTWTWDRVIAGVVSPMDGHDIVVHQAQANVVRDTKPKREPR